MKIGSKFYIPLLLACIFQLRTQGQSNNNPYHVNGNATQENCNCYTLTPDLLNQSGSVWNINKISLNEAFIFNFDVFLGCHDGDGADGIVFVLQPISTSIGGVGGGMGFTGINPSIGIPIDTWQNTGNDDISSDHISINRNGDLNHNSVNNLAGPVPAVSGSSNIEDCNWHKFAIQWDPATNKLTAFIDGVERVAVTMDLVNEVFSGDPMVFWGFTAATGGSKNHQRFCTALTPTFRFPANQQTCFPDPITFIDGSTSFGSIVEWHWDFGDGTIASVPNPAPHVYAQPGIYTASLRILGNNGCLSDAYQQVITVGSEPTAGFYSAPPPYCENNSMVFLDSSKVEFGTINNWSWNLNPGNSTINNSEPGIIYPLPIGSYQVDLTVSTVEGCTSTVKTKDFEVLPIPSQNVQLQETGCIEEPLFFEAQSSNAAVSVSGFTWLLGNGQVASGSSIRPIYPMEGSYLVQVNAVGTNGCLSEPFMDSVKIGATYAYAGKDTVIAIGQPLQLQASGGSFYEWLPQQSFTNNTLDNPLIFPVNNTTLELTASNEMGCISRDTMQVKVYKGPVFYVPNAFTPNNDGINDLLHFVAPGMVEIQYFRLYNRYGQLVFTSVNAGNGWDGTSNGRPQDSGTYVWMVSGTDFLGRRHTQKGTVTLIR